MIESRNRNYVIVADCAIDQILLPSAEQYKTIAQAVQEAEKAETDPTQLDEARARAMHRMATRLGVTIEPTYGGPVFNLAQYLRARDQQVSVVSVIGTNPESGQYRGALEKLGVNTKFLLTREGKMPKSVYMYRSPTEQMQAWRGHVSDRAYTSQSDMYKDFLNLHGVMIFSCTNPVVAAHSLREFKNVLAYNPGPLFGYMDFEKTKFAEIVRRAHILSTNASEADAIKKAMGLKLMVDLFTDNQSLEYIITTNGAEGSVLHKRGEAKSHVYDPAESSWNIRPSEIKDDIGAGDAYFATAVALIMNDTAPMDILINATMAAQQSLRFRGGTDPRLINPDASTTAFHAVKKVDTNGGAHGQGY